MPGEFSAERPGFTNGTETVPSRHWQMELGYLYANGDGAYQHRFLDSGQLRYGLSRNGEIRLGLPAYEWNHEGGESGRGFSDLSLSGKWRFLEETNHHPSLALIGGTTLPTGAPNLGEHYFQPYLSLESSRDVCPHAALQTSVTYYNNHDNGTWYDQWAGALNLGISVNRSIDTFIEVYSLSQTGAGAPGALYTDGGITVVLKERFQLDASAGIALTNAVKNSYFISAGFSYRL